jgi:hypothetical protein
MQGACSRSSVVALLLFSVACSPGTLPTAPAPTPGTVSPPPIAPTVPATDFPGVAGPARIYLAAHSLPRPSRYVLYDDGRFALQYLGIDDYRGTYKEANGVITFEWEGWSTAGPWGAAGSLTDEALTVRYNLIMQLSDFDDAVYTAVR